MRILPAFALLLVTASLGTGCKKADDVQPDANANGYDYFAQDAGHWEWESSATEGPLVTPATKGFTRQLVFSRPGLLLIGRDGQPFMQVGYRLSTGPLPRCGQPQANVPIVTFTAEPDVWNNDRKTYSLMQTANGLTLTLVGEDACFDGGYHETYRWVAN